MIKLKKWLIKNWWIAIPLLPFIVMFLLHLSIAWSEYTGWNVNITNIDAKDWFMFFSSYLGGSIALIGIILSIKHGMNLHNHQVANARLENERLVVAQSISRLNVQEPISILKFFMSLNENANISKSEMIMLNDRIYQLQHEINYSRVNIFISSGITIINPNCSICKDPCGLKTIIPDFSNEYESLTMTLHETSNKLSKFMSDGIQNNKLLLEIIRLKSENTNNPLLHSNDKIQSLHEKIKNLNNDIQKLLELCEKCAQMSEKEITKLISLSIRYFIQRQENAKKACFED